MLTILPIIAGSRAHWEVSRSLPLLVTVEDQTIFFLAFWLSFAWLHTSTIMCYFARGIKQRGHSITAWTVWNHELKQTFFFFKSSTSQVFCKRKHNGKRNIMVKHNGRDAMESLSKYHQCHPSHKYEKQHSKIHMDTNKTLNTF